jgi:hypothetical protein
MPLTDSEKLDALKYLSETHRKEFHERRKYEWKLLFTVLAFYVFVVIAILKEEFKILSIIEGNSIVTTISVYFVFILFLSLAFIASKFIYGIHLANEINKSIAEKAENTMESLGVPAVKSEKRGILNQKARVYQILIVWIFAVTALLVVLIRLFAPFLQNSSCRSFR